MFFDDFVLVLLFFCTFVAMIAIVDDKIPFIQGKIEQLVDDVHYVPGHEIGREEVHDAHILIVRTRTRVDEHLLRGSKVRLVVTATIGFDHLDTAWMERAGIRWTNCPGCNASSVRQYVHNALLGLGRLQRGLTAGVVGVGHVGTLVADDLRAAGMNVIVCDPPRLGTPSFEEMDWSEVDILTFHTPLSLTGPYPTYHMADERVFGTLRRKPVVINSARGGVVDEQALLSSTQPFVLDTWEDEPHINPAVLDRALLASYHIAGYSIQGKRNASQMCLDALCRFYKWPSRMIHDEQMPQGDSTPGWLSRITDELKAAPNDFETLRKKYKLR